MSDRNELAIAKKRIIELEDEVNYLKGELVGIAMRRHDDDETLTTTQKLNLEIERRFKGWVWYRDRILAPTLAAIHTLIILAILYMAFREQLP